MAGARRASWVWIVFITVIGAALIAAATFVALRLAAPPPPATLSIQVPATLLVDGGAPAPIPVPARGSFALATSLSGTVAAHDATMVRPIGSVAKVMTALVVLAAHPLAPGAPGPPVTMTGADVLLYRKAVAAGGSNLRVRAGEVLTERDLLLALLLPSADNIAETLAVWVSGNRPTFIARLNATAAAMGMDHTSFADPSGLSAGTVSTASDLVLLAHGVIANAALAELVGIRQAALPDGTVLRNLDVLLGTQPGWLGIKTGWTGAAGGCLLFAATMPYSYGRTVSVWGAVLGQPPLTAGDPAHPELGEAFVSAQSAAMAAFRSYAAVDLAGLSPEVSGSISTRWGGRSFVLLAGHAPLVALVRAGMVLRLHVTVLATPAPVASGSTVAEVTGVLNADTSITWRVISASSIAGPSPWWRLFSA
ncbi:MAG: D-alanyl-D-alanine carboxypeptidase family protein [Candidatus Dormibacteria bacterium]